MSELDFPMGNLLAESLVEGEGTKEREYRRYAWRDELREKIANVDQLDTPPDWFAHELRMALEVIPGPHQRKKRLTVMRLAEARGAGLADGQVFTMKDCCSAPCWYGYTGRDGGWVDIAEIATALVVATRMANWWYDHLEQQQWLMRSRQIVGVQNQLVDMAQLATDTLGNLAAAARSETVQLSAAEAILDRADEATAVKTHNDHTVVVTAERTRMIDIRSRRRNLDQPAPAPEIWQVEDEDDSGPPPPPPVQLMPGEATITGGNGQGDTADLAAILSSDVEEAEIQDEQEG